MRSFLLFLCVLFLVLTGVLWVVLPRIADVLVAAAVRAGGLTCSEMSAEVSADPPLELLLGQAEDVRLQCTEGRVGNLAVGGVDVTFGGVHLFDRQFVSVDGRLTNVTLPAPGDSTVEASTVTVLGDPAHAGTRIVVPLAVATSLAENRVLDVTGVRVTVAASAPNRVSLGSLGAGTLAVANGALVLRPSLPALPEVQLISADDVSPFHLTSVLVTGDSLELSGTVDVLELLGLPQAAASESPSPSPFPSPSRSPSISPAPVVSRGRGPLA